MKNKKTPGITNGNESGVALIVALSVLLLIAAIASSIVAISKISARKSKQNVDRTYSAYLAEGALNRLTWLIISDKILKQKKSYFTDPSSDFIYNEYSAIGKTFKLDYYDSDVEYSIFDMSSGFNISKRNPAGALQDLLNYYSNNGHLVDEIKHFLEKLSDYTERGKNARLNGLNKQGYALLGMAPLPRDDKMQFREEILWIPGADIFFKPDSMDIFSVFDVISPKGLSFKSSSVNFFSANKLLVMIKSGFNSDQVKNIIKRREEWFKSDESSLYRFYSHEILSKLRQNFTFKDSGYYTLIIKASQDKGLSSQYLIESLKIDASIPEKGITYYQYQLY